MLKADENTAVGEKGNNREPLGSSYKKHPGLHVTFWLWHSVKHKPFFHSHKFMYKHVNA